MHPSTQKEPHSTWWLAALLAMAHGLLGFACFLPHFYNQESIYIVNARSLLGIRNNFYNSQPVGFSLLLVPAQLFAHPLAPYYLAILLNALGLGWIFFALVKIARDEGSQYPVLCALAASCFPPCGFTPTMPPPRSY